MIHKDLNISLIIGQQKFDMNIYFFNLLSYKGFLSLPEIIPPENVQFYFLVEGNISIDCSFLGRRGEQAFPWIITLAN